MKLAIAQIGADIDAPSSLIDSGKYSVSALESLLKKWLHHAINQLQLDVSETELLKGNEVCLDDISIELPDIDLNALQADPKGYFEREFSPVIRRVLQHSIEVQLNAQNSATNTKASELVSSVADIDLAHLDEKVIACLKEVFFRCIAENKQVFLNLIASAEWPAVRNGFIKAMSVDTQQIASFIDVFIGKFISLNIIGVVKKLSEKERYLFWLDIESIYCAMKSSQPQQQERLKVLVSAYSCFVNNDEFDRSTLNRVVTVLLRPQSELKLLKTWFAIKSSSQLANDDRSTLTRIANGVLTNSKAEEDLVYILQQALTQTSLKDVLQEFSSDTSFRGVNEMSLGSQEKLMLMPLYHQFKQGFKSSYFALQKLNKLLVDRSEHLELPLFDSKRWFSFFAEVDALGELPQPIYRLLEHIRQTVIYQRPSTEKKLKKIDYLLKLVERELQAISKAPERLLNYVYANRIRTLVCTFDSAPAAILQKLQNHCSAVRILGTPLQQNVNLKAYTELLNELSYWLVEKKHVFNLGCDVTQPENEAFGRLSELPKLYTDLDSATYVEQGNITDGTKSDTQNTLACAIELQGPLSKLVAKQQTRYFEQAQVSQYRLALSVIKQGLNLADKAILETQIIGANTQVLALLVRKYGAGALQLSGQNSASDDVIKTHTRVNQRFESEAATELSSLCNTLRGAVHAACMTLEKRAKAQETGVEAVSSVEHDAVPDLQLTVDKSNSAIKQLKQAQLLEVLTRIRRYLSTLEQQLGSVAATVSLRGIHQLAVELSLCFVSWRTLLNKSETIEIAMKVNRTIDKSLLKLQRLQKKIHVLNPYLENLTQKTSSWWGGLLHSSVDALTNLYAMGRDIEISNARELVKESSSPQCIELDTQSDKPLSYAPTDLLIDLVSIQSASSYHEVLQTLTHFIDGVEEMLVKNKLSTLPSHLVEVQSAAPPLELAREETTDAFGAHSLLNVERSKVSERINDERTVDKKTSGQDKVSLDHELKVAFPGVEEASRQRKTEHFYSSAKRIVSQSKALIKRLEKQAEKHEARILTAGFSQLQKQTIQALESAKSAYQSSTQRLVSEDAGIVLLWPFLETLYRKFELLTEHESGDVAFCNEQCQQKAHQLLCYLVSTDPQNNETYAINALLGLPLDHFYEYDEPLGEAESSELERLLEVAVARWEALKGMPVNVFREMFLHRNGEVNLTSNGVSIVVETKPQDILMMKLPWGLGIAQLPWLVNDLINIEWQYGV
ncbi:contractile injection system tape measure protein [Pseudoalteromonas luteoviolacea]|uniref:Uncharacterized protein n=1 Tax=Pseudoalteromonas luteoviolacea NCIMB 1942 TaxID=1365253 RepID=A0A161YCR4_9GAMM|nr:contractile injection system tape measure protein [Pseudoalteromonas luteoviolacea]KZN57730.1 hypothetical protein N482_04320 [Pseudoalteromonas luteoviolacea NCIMB 1942]